MEGYGDIEAVTVGADGALSSRVLIRNCDFSILNDAAGGILNNTGKASRRDLRIGGCDKHAYKNKLIKRSE